MHDDKNTSKDVKVDNAQNLGNVDDSYLFASLFLASLTKDRTDTQNDNTDETLEKQGDQIKVNKERDFENKANDLRNKTDSNSNEGNQKLSSDEKLKHNLSDKNEIKQENLNVNKNSDTKSLNDSDDIMTLYRDLQRQVEQELKSEKSTHSKTSTSYSLSHESEYRQKNTLNIPTNQRASKTSFSIDLPSAKSQTIETSDNNSPFFVPKKKKKFSFIKFFIKLFFIVFIVFSLLVFIGLSVEENAVKTALKDFFDNPPVTFNIKDEDLGYNIVFAKKNSEDFAYLRVDLLSFKEKDIREFYEKLYLDDKEHSFYKLLKDRENYKIRTEYLYDFSKASKSKYETNFDIYIKTDVKPIGKYLLDKIKENYPDVTSIQDVKEKFENGKEFFNLYNFYLGKVWVYLDSKSDLPYSADEDFLPGYRFKKTFGFLSALIKTAPFSDLDFLIVTPKESEAGYSDIYLVGINKEKFINAIDTFMKNYDDNKDNFEKMNNFFDKYSESKFLFEDLESNVKKASADLWKRCSSKVYLKDGRLVRIQIYLPAKFVDSYSFFKSTPYYLKEGKNKECLVIEDLRFSDKSPVDLSEPSSYLNKDDFGSFY